MNSAIRKPTESVFGDAKPQMLVVDDDLDILASIRDLLEVETLPVDIHCASNESDARRIAETCSIDIALLDIRLGQKNGLDLVPLLKQRNRFVSCLMMTAHRDLKLAVSAIRFGADDYLHKPLDPVHLVNTIGRYLRYQEFRKQKDRAESWFRTIFDTSDQAMFICSLPGEIIDINSRAQALCDIERQVARGKKIWSLDPWSLKDRLSAKLRNALMAASLDSTSLVDLELTDKTVIEFTIRPLRDEHGEGGCLLVEGRDVTRERQKEKQLVDRVFTDELTGLPNRSKFIEYITPLVSGGGRRQRYFSVLFIDLDNFKSVNDSLGHAEGDLLLRKVSGTLMKSVREDDLVARYSGDEFVAVIHENESGMFAEVIAERIRQHIVALSSSSDAHAELSVSIGIARYPEHGNFAEELLRKADEAMYRAKSAGKNRHVVYK